VWACGSSGAVQDRLVSVIVGLVVARVGDGGVGVLVRVGLVEGPPLELPTADRAAVD
jgi:hypothetical protein